MTETRAGDSSSARAAKGVRTATARSRERMGSLRKLGGASTGSVPLRAVEIWGFTPSLQAQLALLVHTRVRDRSARSPLALAAHRGFSPIDRGLAPARREARLG